MLTNRMSTKWLNNVWPFCGHANVFKFTKEILNRKIHFLCSAANRILPVYLFTNLWKRCHYKFCDWKYIGKNFDILLNKIKTLIKYVIYPIKCSLITNNILFWSISFTIYQNWGKLYLEWSGYKVYFIWWSTHTLDILTRYDSITTTNSLFF